MANVVLRGLTKTYGRVLPPAVDRVDLDIRDG
jgi:hypothetical protein